MKSCATGGVSFPHVKLIAYIGNGHYIPPTVSLHRHLGRVVFREAAVGGQEERRVPSAEATSFGCDQNYHREHVV